MNIRWCSRAPLFAMTVLSFTSAPIHGAESAVTSAMVGEWNGNARIIVTWCHQTNLPVLLNIQKDGTVTGKVGDAALTHGHLKRTAGGWVASWT